MRRTKFTELQIVKILKAAEDGRDVTVPSREHAMSSAAFYHWKVK